MLNYFYLFIGYYLCVCAHVCIHAVCQHICMCVHAVCMSEEDNLQGFVLSIHYVGPKIELGNQAANVFTHWVILPSPEQTFLKQVILGPNTDSPLRATPCPCCGILHICNSQWAGKTLLHKMQSYCLEHTFRCSHLQISMDGSTYWRNTHVLSTYCMPCTVWLVSKTQWALETISGTRDSEAEETNFPKLGFHVFTMLTVCSLLTLSTDLFLQPCCKGRWESRWNTTCLWFPRRTVSDQDKRDVKEPLFRVMASVLTSIFISSFWK